LSSAINIFARAVVYQRKIPFEISAPEKSVTREDALKAFLALRKSAEENGLQDMTLEEINAEIAAVRSGETE
jgi:antitoxin component of RelBE/YafQ-DinJ toxin-antitoxin module